MHEEMIPIVMFLVIGLVLSLYFFFRSKDRQLIIEKGLSPDLIENLFRSRRNPFIWLKVGIITACGSLGVILGNFLMWQYPEHWWSDKLNKAFASPNESMMAFSIFFMIGIGFVLAFFLARKMEREEEERKNRA